MASNRHPIDELSDVRSEMKRLKAREDELRSVILGGECGLAGDQFNASITLSQQNKMDMDAVRKALGAELVKAMTKSVPIRVIKLSERELVESE